jgi:hypothetical protein
MSSNSVSQPALLSDDLSKPYSDSSSESQTGGKKVKKVMKKKTASSTDKKKKVMKKKVVKKEIDTFKRVQLERIAKRNKVSLKKRDGTPKTKLQLFKSLKRKKLI